MPKQLRHPDGRVSWQQRTNKLQQICKRTKECEYKYSDLHPVAEERVRLVPMAAEGGIEKKKPLRQTGAGVLGPSMQRTNFDPNWHRLVRAFVPYVHGGSNDSNRVLSQPERCGEELTMSRRSMTATRIPSSLPKFGILRIACRRIGLAIRSVETPPFVSSLPPHADQFDKLYHTDAAPAPPTHMNQRNPSVAYSNQTRVRNMCSSFCRTLINLSNI